MKNKYKTELRTWAATGCVAFGLPFEELRKAKHEVVPRVVQHLRHRDLVPARQVEFKSGNFE